MTASQSSLSGDDWADIVLFCSIISHHDATGDETAVLGQESAEDEGADGGELDENVD